MDKHYLVTTKCGHVGRNNFIPITFPIKAENGRDAARIARMIPRVKHDHADAIIQCREVTEEEFIEQAVINRDDPYLRARSVQEQRENYESIMSRVLYDDHFENKFKKQKKSNKPNLFYQMKKYSLLRDEMVCFA